MRNHALSLGLGLAMFVTLGVLPGTANATVVQCGNQDDSCEVSNEGSDWVSCTCIGEGTGGDEWADFSEGELVEVCESYLMHCNGEGTGDDGGDSSTEEGCGDPDGEGTTDGGEVDGGETDGGIYDGEGEVTGESGGAEDDGGEDSGGDDEPWGCSVGEGSDLGLAVSLALLGLFGLRRRTRV